MTVKSNERCDECRWRVDVFPDEEREMQNLLR
jgi:hypothetical protein